MVYTDVVNTDTGNLEPTEEFRFNNFNEDIMKGKLINALGRIASDKLLHFIVGLLICQIVSKVLGLTSIDHYLVVLIGFFAACAAAVYKEILDDNEEYNDFDNKDLAVSICGAFVGALLML